MGPSPRYLHTHVDGLLNRDIAKQTNNLMVAASPVIWFYISSPWTGPTLISKVDLRVSSLVVHPKPLNNTLVSNDTVASSVEPNGQRLFSFVGSSLAGTFTPVNDMTCPPKSLRGEGRLRGRLWEVPDWHNSIYRCCLFAVAAHGMFCRCAYSTCGTSTASACLLLRSSLPKPLTVSNESRNDLSFCVGSLSR